VESNHAERLSECLVLALNGYTIALMDVRFRGNSGHPQVLKVQCIERELFLILSAEPVPDIVFLLCDHQPHAESYLFESLIPLRALPALPHRATLALQIYGSKT
jgi:hypothetical protein